MSIPRESLDLGDRYLLEQLRPGSVAAVVQEKGWISNPKFAPTKAKVPSVADSSYQIEYEDDHFHSANQAGFKVGARVYHSTYRQGRILSLGGTGKMMRGQIKFDDDGLIRMIMVSHLRLL